MWVVDPPCGYQIMHADQPDTGIQRYISQAHRFYTERGESRQKRC